MPGARARPAERRKGRAPAPARPRGRGPARCKPAAAAQALAGRPSRPPFSASVSAAPPALRHPLRGGAGAGRPRGEGIACGAGRCAPRKLRSAPGAPRCPSSRSVSITPAPAPIPCCTTAPPPARESPAGDPRRAPSRRRPGPSKRYYEESPSDS
ncbi:MAG: hypothetical protein J3K34DRAFT_197158 [Monoraphidium minutum]|nr:MAG: hypothetical protein J3K34DRAFT_197158 [Monoraphidium minutum]